ncbi:MAG: DUF1365 domain-containing protein [Burkholderiaceae bacterium]|nr:DUF1365 domain-containing protein [Burkholderiaceae bacterium]
MQPKERVPQISMGVVRHSRLRPASHAFSYGVFTLLLPLRALGDAGIGSRLCSRNRFNLMSFHDRDHGDGRTPLLTWIARLLADEGIDDADGEIWLQTFPRVLGYVFNPVSFWFCHRSDGALRAVVCEVNNTFGERHCYLLDTGGTMAWGRLLDARKVFHVSPFCAVEGSYRFRFMRATRGAGEAGTERIVARIDYHDNQGPLLLTSVSGVLHPLSDASAARAFLRHPMMTLGVIARIHWQALQLFVKRVPFFSKPIPPTRTVSR